MMDKISKPVMVNQKCITATKVLALINLKVKPQDQREKVKKSMMDILFAPNSIIDIDVNDITDLFQEGGEIHSFETSTDATQENRMEILVEQIRKNATTYEPYSHILVFFFISENHPLLMVELQPFNEWIASVPGEITVKWGISSQSTKDLRAIVLLQ